MNQKRINRRIRCKKFLRQEIDKNHNIFQSRVNLSRNMVAQNILWDKNYSLKQAINQLHEENSSLKARIWNFEKENRKMDRQIEYWSLKEYMATTGKKIYIDTATLEKVLADQDYNIVSMKIDIVELEKTLSHLTK